LIGVLAATEVMTAARFGELARAAAVEIAARGKRVILVGGTGFYLRAALEGLVPAPSADYQLRTALALEAEQQGREVLHARLAQVDPEAAARLSPNDLMRVIRALEVHALTGVSQTELHRRHQRDAPKATWLAVDLPRAALYERIEARAQAIFPGVLEEARALEAAGRSDSPAARALGLSEAIRHLRGELSREAALEGLVRASRRYAKRQLTWFRAVPNVRWLAQDALDPAVLARELVGQS
jgi:tRNA dimethylallyltransferase